MRAVSVQGPFASAFLAALGEPVPDMDKDGLLSVEELFMHLYPRSMSERPTMQVVVDEKTLAVTEIRSGSAHPSLYGRYPHRTMLLTALPETVAAAPSARVAFKLGEGFPAEIKDAKKLKINGEVVDVQRKGGVMTLGAKDAGKLLAGLNVIEMIETQGARFTLWNEANELSKFEKPYKNSHAIVVAVDDYDRANAGCPGKPTGLRKLGFMRENAHKLGETLRAAGFDEVRELYDCDATRTKLDEVLREYWSGGKYEDVDRLFVYFGGHGISYKDATAQDKVLLATYDYDAAKPSLTGFLAEELRVTHANNIKARHVMLALDVCHAGLTTIKQGEGDVLAPGRLKQLRVVRRELEQPARNILVAGTGEQEALYENGGVFTKKLIDALQGEADTDRVGLMTFLDVARYVRSRVSDAVAQAAHKQDPDYQKLDAVGKGEMVFFYGLGTTTAVAGSGNPGAPAGVK